MDVNEYLAYDNCGNYLHAYDKRELTACIHFNFWGSFLPKPVTLLQLCRAAAVTEKVY